MLYYHLPFNLIAFVAINYCLNFNKEQFQPCLHDRLLCTILIYCSDMVYLERSWQFPFAITSDLYASLTWTHLSCKTIISISWEIIHCFSQLLWIQIWTFRCHMTTYWIWTWIKTGYKIGLGLTKLRLQLKRFEVSTRAVQIESTIFSCSVFDSELIHAFKIFLDEHIPSKYTRVFAENRNCLHLLPILTFCKSIASSSFFWAIALHTGVKCGAEHWQEKRLSRSRLHGFETWSLTSLWTVLSFKIAMSNIF